MGWRSIDWRRAPGDHQQRRRSTALSSYCEQCHVYSRRRRLNTELFIIPPKKMLFCVYDCRHEAMIPRTSHDIEFTQDPSLKFSVTITVQAVNHFYHRSPMSSPAIFQFPLSNHSAVFLPQDRTGLSPGNGMATEAESKNATSRSSQGLGEKPEHNFGSPGIPAKGLSFLMLLLFF